MRRERVVQHVELSREQRVVAVGLLLGGADGRERIRVAEQLAPLELDALAPRRGLGRRVGAGLPPRLGQRGLDRPQLPLE
jgi:hypothetical protein